MRERTVRTIVAACFAVVLLIAAVALLRLATGERDAVTAVATPPPVRQGTPVTLEPGQELCEDDVALQRDSRVIRFYSASPVPDVPRLRVTVRGDGWSTNALSPPVGQPGGGAAGIYDTRIDPPPRSLIATVCVRSASDDQPAILAGSDEGFVRTRSQARVDGEELETRVALVVLSGGPRSPLAQARTVLERAATLDPPPVGWLSLGLLLALVIVGVPAAAIYATLRALRDDAPDGAE